MRVTFQTIRSDGSIRPYYGLSKKKEQSDSKTLRNPDEVVISEKQISIVASYPFSRDNRVTYTSDTGFTRKMLGTLICKLYQDMYREERETTTEPEETIESRTKGRVKLLNRAETNGKWGIWGHDLSDLDLVAVTSEDGKEWFLEIDS